MLAGYWPEKTDALHVLFISFCKCCNRWQISSDQVIYWVRAYSPESQGADSCRGDSGAAELSSRWLQANEKMEILGLFIFYVLNLYLSFSINNVPRVQKTLLNDVFKSNHSPPTSGYFLYLTFSSSCFQKNLH